MAEGERVTAVVPKVFISSTVEDLKEYRQAAKDAALKSGVMPVMFEHWPASGDRQPIDACMQSVAECDLLIVLVAHRYGWVAGGKHESITRLECDEALRRGKEVLAFVLDDEAPWPAELKEEYAAVAALQRGIPTAEELVSIRRSIDELKAFKNWLRSRGVRATFRSPADLRGEVIAALNDWHIRHQKGKGESIKEAGDFTRYLRYVAELCGFIDIRGLQVGSGKANKFSIEDLYIRLELKSEGGGKTAPVEAAERQLQTLLERRCAVIIGDPGSGKTTLLRRVAHSLTAAWLRVRTDAAKTDLGIEDEPPLPLLVRVSDFANYLERSATGASDAATADDSPEWLSLFLARMSAEFRWGLDRDTFAELMEQGRAIVLLDGLDEAPSLRVRKTLARLIENCAAAYEHCRFLVTSRPKGYTAESTLRDFQMFEVQPLNEDAVKTFLARWCEMLFRDAPTQREQHFFELYSALDSRSEIRRMATNPVMLTALAVVHWNQKRIPEQRAELYESILTWLSRARENRKGRISAERSMSLLQMVALAMQNHPEGRLVSVRRRWAAEEIAARTGEGGMDAETAERFLMEEELDSGIVVARGDDVRFWHLSFQEYLAARAVAALREQDQHRLLISDAKKVLSPEWRETVLLFAGILHHQGPEKLTAMLRTLVELPAMRKSMTSEANLVGLVGAVQRDLTAFEFTFRDEQLEQMRTRIMRAFDPEEQVRLSMRERLEAADALGQSGDPRLDGEQWVWMEGGTFPVGAQRLDAREAGYDACALENEGPCRTVTIPGFRVLRFPVTVGDYARFIADSGYENAAYWRAGGFGKWKRPDLWDNQVLYSNRPVVGLSWYEARAWCRWAGWGVRLLTEVEWERVARGAEGRLFPWGEAWVDHRFLNKSNSIEGGGRPTPVGFYPLGKTPEGVYDLAGNVFEWCEDEVAVGRRALRGGCFRSVDLFVRGSARGQFPAESRADFIGFRVCSIYAEDAPRSGVREP